MFADLGSTIKLCCEAEASLVWSKAQTALTLVPSSQQNGCLILSNVNRESAGKYTCRASNDLGFADATTEVIVRGDAYTLMQSQIFPFLSHIKTNKINAAGVIGLRITIDHCPSTHADTETLRSIKIRRNYRV